MESQALVQGLSGDEIIVDVLDQVKKALQRDCNLRATDQYSAGYGGKFTLHLDCNSMDTAKVDIEIDLKPSAELVAAGPKITAETKTDPVKVDIKAEIAPESSPEVIRERSQQPAGAEQTAPAAEPGAAATKKRSYAANKSLENSAF